MTVELGVTQWSLPERGVAALDVAARAGLSCIQLDAGGPGRPEPDAMRPEVRRRYRAAAAASGVRIAGVTAGVLDEYGMTARPGTLRRDRCWAAVRAAVETAVELAAPVVYLPAFEDGEIRTDVDLGRAADMLRAAHEHLGPAPTELAVETSLGAGSTRQLLDRAGVPGLRVLFDTYNAVRFGHDPCALFDALGPDRCGQLHVKDGVGGGMGNVPIGAGDGGTERIVRHVIGRGYDGCLLLEAEYGLDLARVAVDVRRLAAWTRDGLADE